MKSWRVWSGCLLACLMVSGQGFAQSVWTWDGGGATGGATNWATAANWLPDGTPANGDYLIFGQAFDTANLNDLANMTFASIWFSNSTWNLFGNAINLTRGVTNTVGGVTQQFLLGITTTVAQTWHNNVAGAGVTLQTNSHLHLNAGVTFTGPGNFTIFGPITGTGAITSGMRIVGTTIPSLQLTNASNTFSGGLVINDSNRVWVTQYGIAAPATSS